MGVVYLIGVADESEFVLEVGLCTQSALVVQSISHTRMRNLKICWSTLKSEGESSHMSRTSLATIIAESLRNVMCRMGMITSVLEMKKFCV